MYLDTLLRYVAHISAWALRLLLLSNPDPDESAWSAFALFLVRAATAAFLFRTILAPWVVQVVTDRIRVRSISFRSIRGLYFRTGATVIQVDRIGLSWRWAVQERALRLAIRVEGVRMDIAKAERKVRKRSSTLTSVDRMPTFSDLSPPPAVSQLHAIGSALFSFVDGLFRPITRFILVIGFRIVIRMLPALTQSIELTLDSATLTFTALAGAKLVVKDAILSTRLEIEHLDATPLLVSEPDEPTRKHKSSRIRNLRLKAGRTWDRAWGNTLCTGSIALKVNQVSSSVEPGRLGSHLGAQSMDDREALDFFNLPHGLDFSVSGSFKPQRGQLESHSLSVALRIGGIDVVADVIRSIMHVMKAESLNEVNTVSPAGSPVPGSPTLSPQTAAFTPATPGSPLMEALSVLRRNPRAARVHRLKPKQTRSWLSIFKDAEFSVARMTFSIGSRASAIYRAAIHDLRLHADLSDPERNSLHRNWLGHSRDVGDNHLQSDVYAAGLSAQRTTVHRINPGCPRFQIMRLGALSTEIIASQWPAPWIPISAFLYGDPNGPLVVVQSTLDGFELAETVDGLQTLMHHIAPSPPPSSSSTQDSSPSYILPFVPRLALDINVTNIRGRLICDDNPAWTLEAHTNAVTLNATTRYELVGPPGFRKEKWDPSPGQIPLYNMFTSVLTVEPTFVRLRTDAVFTNRRRPQSVLWADSPNADGEPVLSMDLLEIFVDGSTRGQIEDAPGTVPVLDMATTFADLLVTTDALSVELWQPAVLTAIKRLVSATAPTSRREPKPATPIINRLPKGLNARLAIASFTIYVTAPDLNPDDDMELSRGIGLRVGLNFSYCAVTRQHIGSAKDMRLRSQLRSQLYLPEERIGEAFATASASTTASAPCALMQATVRNLVVRAAVATRFVADDPYCEEEDDPGGSASEFLRVSYGKLDLSLYGAAPGRSPSDRCVVALEVPYVRGDLNLVNVHSVLLATSALQRLRPPSPPSQPPVGHQQPELAIQFQSQIDTLQVSCELPMGQHICMRIDGVKLYETGLQVGSLLVWVPVFPEKKKRTDDQAQTEPDPDPEPSWEEFGNLREWSVDFRPNAENREVTIVGKAARVRIPHGYVLSELIRDIGLAVKCIKHLHHIVHLDHYTSLANPPAEDAKQVPKLHLKIQSCVFEAADDPLESKLTAIWQAGMAANAIRMEREEAFEAKVASILASESPDHSRPVNPEYHFNSQHSVSVREARQRLFHVHALDWKTRHEERVAQRAREEQTLLQKLLGTKSRWEAADVPNIVDVVPVPLVPPLVRASLFNVSLHVGPPSFATRDLPEFLFSHGGVPRDMEYTLLVPMHLSLSTTSLRLSIRDYQLPLVHVPHHAARDVPSLEFRTNLVVAEELGTSASVEWTECTLVKADSGILGAPRFALLVPKTVMPVKSYATPLVNVNTLDTTDISWAMCYGPALQDVMRVLDTVTSTPRDPSPPLGFWDKLRLQFHWQVRMLFTGDVHLHMKGTRDPRELSGAGAGFVFAWRGGTEITIGHANEDRELIQISSEEMTLGIPEFDQLDVQHGHLPRKAMHKGRGRSPSKHPERRVLRKVCAKLKSGVRLGIGFSLERACGLECNKCNGLAFERKCRHFRFRPHHEVRTVTEGPSDASAHRDSYDGFRSHFIHMSISLTSSLRANAVNSAYSSFHLSPHVFTHFWEWWSVFDRRLNPPVRSGPYFEKGGKHVSPKFGKNLATIKYRIAVHNVFITHVYTDDSQSAWADGVSPRVGVKALIEHFRTDLHQREEETMVPGILPGTTRAMRGKPFNAVEVVLQGLDLRTILAIFPEPLKEKTPLDAAPQSSEYRERKDLPATDVNSKWYDLDDFVDVDWEPSSELSNLHVLPAAAVPQFTYFKRVQQSNVSRAQGHTTSKFGDEDTHVCLLGKEASVSQVQIEMARSRIAELRATQTPHMNGDGKADNAKMIALLEDYVAQLLNVEAASSDPDLDNRHYYMPVDSVLPAEWADFDNVYQIHSPKIFLNNAIRDIMMKYYHLSRQRRGFEYHMATRAVKFIRDQAEATVQQIKDKRILRGAAAGAQTAANALRKFLVAEQPRMSVLVSKDLSKLAANTVDPLNGWTDGVSLTKSHFCLLLKPQIVLRSEVDDNSVCIVAAVHAKLQSFAIMDDANAEDPVAAKVMSRIYTSLTGLQTFAPCNPQVMGDGCVPLEVLVDLRCESQDFDRLVPQTDATIHYDRFNRLRLRNNITSVVQSMQDDANSHLHHQTDLLQVVVPRFTVSADDRHFQSISDIVGNLLLHSDPALKVRVDKLETLQFTYDFTDLASSANVVANLQNRLRAAVSSYSKSKAGASNGFRPSSIQTAEGLKGKAHILGLSEELDLIFDAIKLAQDKVDDKNDKKSALLLRTLSSEVSWRMLDERRELLAKLAIGNIDFSWLSRQDSSTVNKLIIGDMHAFDGSPGAEWTEILSKHDEPANHPLVKEGRFLVAEWAILPPVGGITIYEEFDLKMHPMRLQLDTRVGKRMMQYIFPARKQEKAVQDEDESPATPITNKFVEMSPEAERPTGPRLSADVPRGPRQSMDGNRALRPPLRKLGSSRSFNDIRSAAMENELAMSQESLVPRRPPKMQRNFSFAPSIGRGTPDDPSATNHVSRSKSKAAEREDAEEMKTRSSQKTFVLVKVASLHLVLSIEKEDAFLCRDARIQTRPLEFRNQTWSLEELVNQFIPSGPGLRGWIKFALQQPLIPVLPVARELLSKTKRIASKGHHVLDHYGRDDEDTNQRAVSVPRKSLAVEPSGSSQSVNDSAGIHTDTSEPDLRTARPSSRNRMMSMFRRRSRPRAGPRTSVESTGTSSSTSSDAHSQSYEN